MYKRIYNFLEKKRKSYFHSNLVFVRNTLPLMLWLNSLIKLDMRLIKVNMFFVDFQMAFYTVDHHILLKKLENYGVRGISNKWFAWYLSNRKPFVSINGHKSNLADVKCVMPCWDLLFLIYIYYLCVAIKYSEVHHFADDTSITFYKL